MNKKRTRLVKDGKPIAGPVVYWMSRDQRTADNWALIYAQELAFSHGAPLAVVFNLVPTFLQATIRQYGFMLKGLAEVEKKLAQNGIAFHLLSGDPVHQIPKFVNKYKISQLVTDFSPLRLIQSWHKSVADQIDIPFWEVDAHNIIPCWVVSQKCEYGAYTIRPKIHKLLGEYLEEFPPLKKHTIGWVESPQPIDWKDAEKSLQIDFSVKEVDSVFPGETAARNTLDNFISQKFENYSEKRNDPAENFQSGLSPYFHFGQIAPQRAALEAERRGIHKESKESFLEELIVRRELSDNFCFYNEDYDNFNGFPNWAKESFALHKKDKRQYLYTLEQFELAKTHDDLWNAAQFEMLHSGKMHGYMRMYWAKKILEWTKNPDEALRIAIYLNDKYEIDGRDPNGYTGIMWSIGGVHDRAWYDRPIFGKIRYMSYTGCKSKFDIRKYIDKYSKPTLF